MDYFGPMDTNGYYMVMNNNYKYLQKWIKPEWTTISCLFKLFLLVKVETHCLHLYGFSPIHFQIPHNDTN